MEAADLALLIVKRQEEEFVLIHQHQEWILEDQPEKTLDTHIVDLFVSRVVNIPAEILLERKGQNKSRYGLNSPTTNIIGIDRDGRRRGFLSLGDRTSGLVYAMGAGLPGIHQARSIILTQIPSRNQLLADSNSR